MTAAGVGSVRAVVNGEPVEVAEGTLLVDFLRSRGVDSPRLAIERNRDVVPRSAHASLVIRQGDVFEVVHFVGGG